MARNICSGLALTLIIGYVVTGLGGNVLGTQKAGGTSGWGMSEGETSAVDKPRGECPAPRRYVLPC